MTFLKVELRFLLELDRRIFLSPIFLAQDLQKECFPINESTPTTSIPNKRDLFCNAKAR